MPQNVQVMCWSCASIFVTADDNEQCTCPSCGQTLTVEDAKYDGEYE